MNITIAQVGAVLGTIVAIITAVEFLIIRLNKLLDKKLLPINDKMLGIDEAQCKNFLVRFLKDKEAGNYIDPVEEERAYEVYDHYVNELHKNSYIHDKWNRLMK